VEAGAALLGRLGQGDGDLAEPAQDVVHPGLRAISYSLVQFFMMLFGYSMSPIFIGAISARYDLLMAPFALLFLLVSAGAGAGRNALSGLTFLAGLLSKETFAAMIPVVAADDWGARRRVRDALPRWLAVAAAVAAWIGLRMAFAIPAMRPAPLADLPRHWLSVLWIYSGRAFWPVPLTVSHPYASAGAAGLAGGVSVAALLAALTLRRRDLAPATALVLAPLVPVALAAGRLGEAPERYFYLPSLGMAWLLAAGLAELRVRHRSAFAAAAAACVLLAVAGAWMVVRRLPDWVSDDALFSAAVRVDPTDPHGTVFQAIAAGRLGRLEEARSLLERSQALHPTSGRLASVHAWVHLRRGDGPAALEQARRATSLLPGSPEARLYLANALHLVGDHAGELVESERALRLSPGWRQARIVRALAVCEVERDVSCEAGLAALEREGLLTGADALVARVEVALARRDLELAASRLGQLRAVRPGDPRIGALTDALEWLRGR
jgi:tetratricopeptide (TPR) repeat protein